MDTEITMIEEHLRTLFAGKIDLSDLSPEAADAVKVAHFRTRALAAYVLYKELGLPVETAADAVVDGGQDYGIDAVLFYAGTKNLYIVQSKFVSGKNSGIEKGEVLSFIDGVRLLFNDQLNNANARLTSKLSSINSALTDPETTAKLVVITTGGPLAGESLEPADRFVREKNSQSDEEWLTFECFSNADILDLVASDRSPKDRDIEVPLKDWGSIQAPSKAFYGQLSAVELGKWYKEYGKDLVSANIRNYLGASTEINKKIVDSLNSNPTNFFYLNNGITAISTLAKNTNKFSDSRDAGSFLCSNLKIINGAQTYGSIGRVYKDSPDKLKDAWVMFKVISVGTADESLRQSVTVSTNSQNKIEAIDFASMEPQQLRLESEMLRGFNIRYVRLREDLIGIDAADISISDAASAMVCFEDDVKLCIDHKREINKIWDDLRGAPYSTLFNPSTTARKLVNCVAALKRFRKFIASKNLKKGREATFSKSGDHFLLHMIMLSFDNRMALIQKKPDEFNRFLDDSFTALVSKVYDKCWGIVSNGEKYKTAQLARLLISPKLVSELKGQIAATLND